MAGDVMCCAPASGRSGHGDEPVAKGGKVERWHVRRAVENRKPSAVRRQSNDLQDRIVVDRVIARVISGEPLRTHPAELRVGEQGDIERRVFAAPAVRQGLKPAFPKWRVV